MASVICVGTGAIVIPVIPVIPEDHVELILIVNVGTPGHCDYGRHFVEDITDCIAPARPESLIVESSWQKMNKGCFSKKERRTKNPQRRVLSHAS